MVVLKSINRDWHLFWVFEAIGLGFGLAILAVKLTGTAESVNTDTANRCGVFGCSLYEWEFVVGLQPFATAAIALLLNILLVRPAILFQHILCGKALRASIWFSFVLLCWVFSAGFVGWQMYIPELVVVVILALLCAIGKLPTFAITGRRLLNMASCVNDSQHEPQVTSKPSIWALGRGNILFCCFCLLGYLYTAL